VRVLRSSLRLGGLTAVLGVTLLCSACDHEPARKPTFPAQGKVLYKGKPISPATVTLIPKDPSQKERPTATTREDGSFKLSTYTKSPADGAPAGDYQVTVSWTPSVPAGNGEFEPGPNRLPKKYEKPESSGLNVKITEGPNQIQTFDLGD
jgi:hypothetical protein